MICLLSYSEEGNDFNLELIRISKKWKEEWEKHNVNESNIEESKPKFFVTAAFPYTNGPLHLGHALTYSIPDVIARYKRMKGYNVLFPMGFHFTGTPIISISEAVSRNDSKTIKRLIDDGVPEELIGQFRNPITLATYFKERAIHSLKNLLLMIDWRRTFTSVDEEFQKFIEWQFLKLKEKGYIVQGTHPVGWCPYHQSPVSMHDTLNDVEPEIQEFTMIYFYDEENKIYPIATLRPETIYGVTNLWINPSAKYVLVDVDNKKMVLSEEAAHKLVYQKKSVTILQHLDASSLLGLKVINPITNQRVNILPAKFVDPDTGTGIVMSVPAHAPFDYAALLELDMEKVLAPISIIDINGKPSFLGVEVVQRQKISSASRDEDKRLLEELTKEVYLREFSNGRMSKNLSKLVSGNEKLIAIAKAIEEKTVVEAREYLKKTLLELGMGDVFFEIANKPVYCRCGTKIVVKIVENQWFINYEDEKWKEQVHSAFRDIQIIPDDYREQFINTVSWLKKKACARSRGLGTPLPWDKNWIIESLSDSTIYMAFYTIIHKIRHHKLKADKLVPEFWDYVLLGKGDPKRISESLGISIDILNDIRREFEYWYPLDNRHSGKDLIPNHLTFMVFNHVAIFPSEKWPRRIIVNGHIMVEGLKMSKSLGNFITIDKILKEISPDVLRLSLILGAEVGNDVNYTKQLSISVLQTLEEIYKLVYTMHTANNKDKGHSIEEMEFYEKVIETKMNKLLIEIESLLDNYKLRAAAIKIYHELLNELKMFVKVTGVYKNELVDKIIETWIRLMAPFTPAFAEELWNITAHNGFVIEQEWPQSSLFGKDPEYSLYMKYIDTIIQDVTSLKGLFVDKKRLIIVTARNKPCYPAKAVKHIVGNVDLKELTRELSREGIPSAFEYAKRLSMFVKQLDSSEIEMITKLCEHEKTILEKATRLLKTTLNMDIDITDEVSIDAQLLSNKKKQAPLPLRPTLIFV